MNATCRVVSGHESGHDAVSLLEAQLLARPINTLSARKVSTLSKPGRHSDGGGLYLRITPGGARCWVFMTAVGGKRAEIGLGSASAVSLATARRLSAEMREAVALGRDARSVLDVNKAPPSRPVPTFNVFAEQYISSIEAGWKSSAQATQWRNSLRDHASELRDKPVDRISAEDVLVCLQPIWLRIPETAGRVRGRIERILDAAKARGLVPREHANPARLRGHLDLLLPRPPSMSRGHHPALPYDQAPAFMGELRKRSALAARCLEFTILTAARSGEALGALWSEIDLEERVWRVPAARMKAGVEHVVPLSKGVMILLNRTKEEFPSTSDTIFAIDGAKRSNMAMAMLLRRMQYGHITTHGFRSTFRDWAGDRTSHQREIVEAALAHTIKDKAERAYRRGTAIERRRYLMEDWANYLSQGASASGHSASGR